MQVDTLCKKLKIAYMNYILLSYEQLLAELDSIRRANLETQDMNAEFVERTAEAIEGTEVEYLSRMFDGYRVLFNQAEEFFSSAMHELRKVDVNLELKPNVTSGMTEQMSSFGEQAYRRFLSFKPNVDKEQLNKVEEFSGVLNTWYALVCDNLYSLSYLQDISLALSRNFRYIQPIADVNAENIAVQRNGITITKGDEIYINESALSLTGQRKKIMLLLSHHHITNPGLPLSWLDIELEIREGNGELAKDYVVNRVSDLRTRLKEQGFDKDVIEIKNTMIGDDTAWWLEKH